MKVSVIVPVYNVEEYLRECLDSLLRQDLDEMEVIIVNDGTKDNSQIIIDEYVSNYPDIFQGFRKENGGLASARNFGLQYATGYYLAFLDSDDYLSDGILRKMHDMAEKDDLDLVTADYLYFWENGETFLKEGLNKVNDDLQKAMFISPLFSCGKLFKRSLFERLNLRFAEGLWYEDLPVTLKYFAYAPKIGYLKETAYHYRQRSGSIMGSSYNEKMYDIFTVFERILKEFKEEGLYDKFHDELEYLLTEHFLWYGAFRFLRTDHYNELIEKAYNYVNDTFPEYKRNKYVKKINLKNRVFINTISTKTDWLWKLIIR